MTNYLFICKNCSPTGLETFKKNQARKLKLPFKSLKSNGKAYFMLRVMVVNSLIQNMFCFLAFPQMCLTAIANLRQESVKDGSNKLLFSKDREIIPYIDQYWEAMTTMPRRWIYKPKSYEITSMSMFLECKSFQSDSVMVCHSTESSHQGHPSLVHLWGGPGPGLHVWPLQHGTDCDQAKLRSHDQARPAQGHWHGDSNQWVLFAFFKSFSLWDPQKSCNPCKLCGSRRPKIILNHDQNP